MVKLYSPFIQGSLPIWEKSLQLKSVGVIPKTKGQLYCKLRRKGESAMCPRACEVWTKYISIYWALFCSFCAECLPHYNQDAIFQVVKSPNSYDLDLKITLNIDVTKHLATKDNDRDTPVRACAQIDFHYVKLEYKCLNGLAMQMHPETTKLQRIHDTSA